MAESALRCGSAVFLRPWRVGAGGAAPFRRDCSCPLSIRPAGWAFAGPFSFTWTHIYVDKGNFLAQIVTFREQTSIPSQSISHSACFLSSFPVLEARGGASAQAWAWPAVSWQERFCFCTRHAGAGSGLRGEGRPRSAARVDSGLEGDLPGLLRLLQGPGPGRCIPSVSEPCP